MGDCFRLFPDLRRKFKIGKFTLHFGEPHTNSVVDLIFFKEATQRVVPRSGLAIRKSFGDNVYKFSTPTNT
jgi:hypothetical protein